MTHRTFRGLSAFVVLLMAGLASADAKILSQSGIVRTGTVGSDVFVVAASGQALAPGTLVVTGENGRVAIEVKTGNVVRLRGNAKLQIVNTDRKTSRFKLMAGRIKGSFTRLLGGETFEMEFASSGAVASVKGTTFTAEESPSGFVMHTLFGDIEVSTRGAIHDVMQGCGILVRARDGAVVVRRLSDGEIAMGGLHNDAAGRRDLDIFQASVSEAADQDAALVTQIREDDFAVGRTMKDVHGNIARIDQRLSRPDPSTIQFINLVKRDAYTYKGKFTYAGPSGPRYDYLEYRVQFNMGLPDNVMDWPAFVVANGDSLETIYA